MGNSFLVIDKNFFSQTPTLPLHCNVTQPWSTMWIRLQEQYFRGGQMFKQEAWVQMYWNEFPLRDFLFSNFYCFCRLHVVEIVCTAVDFVMMKSRIIHLEGMMLFRYINYFCKVLQLIYILFRLSVVFVVIGSQCSRIAVIVEHCLENTFALIASCMMMRTSNSFTVLAVAYAG